MSELLTPWLNNSCTGSVPDQDIREGNITPDSRGPAAGSDCVKQLPELEPPEAEETETFRFVSDRMQLCTL